MDPERHTRALKNLCCKFYTIYCPKLYYWLPYTTLGCTLHSLFQAPGPQNWLKHEHENKMRGDWESHRPLLPRSYFRPPFTYALLHNLRAWNRLCNSLYYTTLNYTTPHYTVCATVLCCAMLCSTPYFAICRTMRCHVIPCYAMLYYTKIIFYTPWKKLALVGHEQWLPAVYVLAEFFLELPL